MLEEKYIEKIRKIIKKCLSEKERVFVFGSAADSEHFNDVDLGISGKDGEKIDMAIYKIKDALEESDLPYKFDIININKTENPFRERVMDGPKIWII